MAKETIEYDAHEDFRFPVNNLYKGLWVLKKHGYTKFRDYANRINMPNQDIERVLNKYKYETDPTFRKEIHDRLREVERKLDGTDFKTEISF